ncbi:hypothetical protein BH18ACT13_BH18ACT13_20060 [soil metagenome]
MTPTIFSSVEPREDVLAGVLSDAIFAASLDEVVAGSAPAVYGHPATFFAGTHPAAGLRTLLGEVLGRVGGGKSDAPSVIRLETNLGGGKTHNLIALYHAARGELPSERVSEFMSPALYPSAPVDHVAVFVGTSAGATTFPEVDGVSARTLWGYLALQLGGKDVYSYVEDADQALTAPGSDALKDVLGGASSLILIDELARYLETASGVEVGATTLARQTVAFLMALMEAVDAHPRASLVVTTTQVTDAFGDSTQAVLDAMSEARALMARREHVLRPSEEADLPKILSRRLFERVDTSAPRPVAEAYAQMVDEAVARGTDLPDQMRDPRWVAELEGAFPFHPTLLRVLDKRLSTIPNFQRTRGALRLLARVTRSLWERRPDGADLIRLDHVDLAEREIAEDLSSRLDRARFDAVIRADVCSQAGGESSHAELVDKQMGADYARRLAIAAYLFSLTQDVPGVTAGELVGSILAPGDDPNVTTKALDTLERSAWYLHSDARGYRFSTEINLNKLIDDATREVSTQQTKQRATQILAEQFKDSTLKVRRAWEDAKVADRAEDAWLVIIHWDDFGDAQGVDPSAEAPGRVLDLFERTPTEGLREFRNRLVILVPTTGTHQTMLGAVRRHLTLAQLAGNSETLSQLSAEKRADLVEFSKQSELEARIAVCNHVNQLYVPQADNRLEPVELDVVTQASLKRNQTEAILDRLAAMEKTLAAGDKIPDPAYVKSKLGNQLDSAFPTAGLVLAFARRTDLKMVLDKAQLNALVSAGVRNGVWEYHDATRGDDGWATKERPDAAFRLGEDAFLYPLGAAPEPTPKACPFCGRIHPPGPCPDGNGPPPPPTTSMFQATGSAGVAFAEAKEKAIEAGRVTLVELRVRVEELGAGAPTQLAKLHSVVPTTQAGATVRYDVDLAATLDVPEDTFTLGFHGTPAKYQPLREAVRQAVGEREASVRATLTAVFEPALQLAGQEVADMQQRTTDTGPAKCAVTIVTEAPSGTA